MNNAVQLLQKEIFYINFLNSKITEKNYFKILVF